MNSRKAHPENCIYFVDVRHLLMHFDPETFKERLKSEPFDLLYTRVFKEFGYAVSFAYDLARTTENTDNNAFAIVYCAYDLRRNPEWLPDHLNKENNSWGFALAPHDFAFFEAQPIAYNDVADKMTGFYFIEHFRNPKVDFVPRPHFVPPNDVDELSRNLELYLRYRTGEERRHIPYLRHFLFFKGFDKGTKEAAANNLLEKINNDPRKELTPRDKAALNNGLLREATRQYEAILLRHLFAVPN